MDAQIPQRDGFRFMYALPLERDRLLLEDTYFSDSPALDQAEIEREIMAYATALGCDVDRVARREVGCLPLPTRTPRRDAFGADGPLVAGYQGGWFHPLTGYSFPVAVRLAHAIATAASERVRDEVWPELSRAHRAQFRFAALLNRLLFSAFAPEERWGAIERFYRLPSPTVRRFYALSLTRSDRLRLLCGRPPRGFSLPRVLSSGRARAEATS
jgi:lycopene beta-cyclase